MATGNGSDGDVVMWDPWDSLDLSNDQESLVLVSQTPEVQVGTEQDGTELDSDFTTDFTDYGISDSTKTPIATQSGIDLAVQYLLPVENRTKNALDPKTLHKMDTKFVQTVSGEMIIGDTLILINVPRGHLPNRTCTGSSYPRQYCVRIRSSMLRYCGFDLFPRLLDDKKYQTKTFRRFATKQIPPPDVAYILDLGPSTDEDLQSTQLETLSLSKGLTRWHKSAKVSPYASEELVAGHDDCCECADAAEAETNGQLCNGQNGAQGSIWDPNFSSPKYRNIEDYCEVRHAANVVRLFRAIAGMPGSRLLLNSAPRVFTIAGLAKLFELNLSDQCSWLRNEVLCWFLAAKNSQIMEILTEESIIMAYHLKISKVARTTYRLLVSEHALQLESGEPIQRGGQHFSVFGRPLRDINDDAIQTAVEHGGQALVERVLGIAEHLESDHVLSWLGLKEWRILEQLVESLGNSMGSSPTWKAQSDLQSILEAFAAFKTAMLRFIHQQVADAAQFHHQTTTIDAYTSNISHYACSNRPVQFTEIWNNLNKRQKQLTAAFWNNLRTRWPEKIYGMPEAINLKLLAMRLETAIANSNHPPIHTGQYHGDGFYKLDLNELSKELCDSINSKVYELLVGKGHGWPENSELQLLTISSHLLTSLDEEEMRFLPLWADGLNDGSGGVYLSIIPPDMSDTAPIQPGPAYVTGHSRATETTNSTIGDLDLGDLEVQSIATMTETNAAGRATCSTIVPSQVGGSEDLDFYIARYADPADHQPVSVGVFGLVDTLEDDCLEDDFDSRSNSTVHQTSITSLAGTDTESRSSDWAMI